MGDYTAKLTKTAADHLEDGESFVAGAKCVPAGGIKRRAIGGGFGAIGAAVASTSRTRSATPSREQALPSSLALGLTDRRLFVFSVSTRVGSGQQGAHRRPARAGSRRDGETGRTIGIKQLNVTIVFVDGSRLQLEVPRVELTKGRTLVGRAPGGHGRERPAERPHPSRRRGRTVCTAARTSARCPVIRSRVHLSGAGHRHVATAAPAGRPLRALQRIRSTGKPSGGVASVEG